MIQNPEPKSSKFICNKCKTIFSPYGENMLAKCPKCGSKDIDRVVKNKTEVVTK
jgi:DNA-directed RNA polymerase subunit RPC12/RpoP